ncbi:MAG: hypothetical protein JOZ69_09645 [Myxococcales bacterium]|nr:hypothetical protein [Myxococcales bacterium]
MKDGARGTLLAALCLAACARRPPPEASAGEAPGAPPDRAAVAVAPAVDGGSSGGPALGESEQASSAALVAPPGAGEGRRSLVAAFTADPRLVPFARALREHFLVEPVARVAPAERAKSGPFLTQWVDLAGGRSAVLVTRADDVDPVVLAVDRDVVAWSKPRPVAGMTAPVVHLALAPRPDGGVALFGYVAALRLLAARMWADDGNAFADIELGSFEACDALSAAYGPGLGWIVACSSDAGLRAQRLREDGTTAWGREGAAVGPGSAAGPPAIVPEGPDAWTIVARAKGVAADHALAWRYDAQARAAWASPVDLGALPPSRVRLADDRLDARAAPGHAVRVTLPRGLAGKVLSAAEIGPDGGVRFSSP